MKFDKENVISVFNYNDDYLYQKGYFADTLAELIECVEAENDENANRYGEVVGIDGNDEDEKIFHFRDLNWDRHFSPLHKHRYFYPVERPKDMLTKYRPYANLIEMYEDRISGPPFFVRSQQEMAWGMMSDKPFLLRIKDSGSYLKIQSVEFDSDTVDLGSGMCTLRELFEDYEWEDGKVCGKEDDNV